MSSDSGGSGPLSGLRVVELSEEKCAFAGKILADMGADVIKVEPLSGDNTRDYGPFADDIPDREHSLYFWHYNTNKRAVTLNLEQVEGQTIFRRLVASADVLLESEPHRRLAELGLDYEHLQPVNERLIMVSITPFGRSGPRSTEQATDLTILAGAGPVWSCGYDDQTLPPIRPGGNQGYQTGCHFAVLSVMVALLSREQTGRGQLIDVNLHAASNVTTEAASYTWLVSGQTVRRQTGRHASTRRTMDSQVQCADGRYVNSGVPPRSPSQFGRVYQWIESLGLIDQFYEAAILEAAMHGPRIQMGSIEEDDDARMKLAAGREAMNFLAAHLPAYDFFIGGQERGFQNAIIYSPEEAMEDPHVLARGFPVEVEHPELNRHVRYPGAPYRFSETPWQIRRRAPLLGEDNDDVLAEVGVDDVQRASLKRNGVI
ncbi:MAG: CaiB/BaiF CoA transferase family protein [Dehalococcoidia bacterium]